MAEDYMSDALLAPDPSPKLPKSLQRARDRRHGVQKQPALSQLQTDRRTEGLQVPIPAANKGFQLLARMGYRPGTGLGKTESGPAQAIPVVVKRDRQGLGSEVEVARRSKVQRMEDTPANTAAYRQRIHDRLAQQQLRRDFCKYLSMCQDLDATRGLESSPFCDPLHLQRCVHALQPGPCFGCIYRLPSGGCVMVAKQVDGHQHPNSSWLCATIPDLQHMVLPLSILCNRESVIPNSQMKAPEAYAVVEEWCQTDAEEEVQFSSEDIDHIWPQLVAYLRGTHWVCVHCGTQYTSEADLEANCPGPTKEAHEGCDALEDE